MIKPPPTLSPPWSLPSFQPPTRALIVLKLVLIPLPPCCHCQSAPLTSVDAQDAATICAANAATAAVTIASSKPEPVLTHNAPWHRKTQLLFLCVVVHIHSTPAVFRNCRKTSRPWGTKEPIRLPLTLSTTDVGRVQPRQVSRSLVCGYGFHNIVNWPWPGTSLPEFALSFWKKALKTP